MWYLKVKYLNKVAQLTLEDVIIQRHILIYNLTLTTDKVDYP